MKTEAAGINLIAGFEQCRLKAYKDGGGVWTIGFGHTGPEVKEGETITQDEADELFYGDLIHAEQCVDELVTVPLTQNQYDALSSWSFNLGYKHLKGSTMLKLLNKGNYASAAEEILKWNQDNGKVVAGLVRRREAERKLFLS